MILEAFATLKINKQDLQFFFPLAAVSGVLMEAFSWLPERVNRGLFANIIYDHIPLTSIGTIFFLQAIIVLLYHAIKCPRIQVYAHDIVEHISIKMEHFCSPAFSVLLGLSLACTIYSVINLSSDYLPYSLAFGYFSIFFLVLPWASSFLKRAINSQFKQSTIELLKVLGLAFSVAIVVVPFLNKQPISVDLKFSLSEYDIVERAIVGEKSISDFAKKAAVDAALEINAKKRVN